MELVQLYRAQGNSEEIESRLNTIVNRYQKTSVSAEAYYQLGQIYSSTLWDLSKAKEYFSLVSKESSKSIFVPMANSRISAIDTYNDVKKDLETYQSLKKLRMNLMTQQKQMYRLSFLIKQSLNCCIILEILRHLLSKDIILGLIILI